ncbi:MAG TPA: membrane protein insertase YidC, partial [Casimicrobiaceae bacterium]|nr:membrane protein insertase YidC [Casimicrobiaceae bacterium]
MDIQRLILWLVFSFSSVMLWQAWEREHNPPVPVSATQSPAHALGQAAAPAGGGSATGAGAVPSGPATAASATAAGGVPTTGAAVPAGRTVEIHTDLYTADIDTVGGIITRMGLAKHRDAEDKSKPYYVLLHNADRTFVAQAGLIGDGLPNHRTPYEVLPGPRSLPEGADHFDLKLQASAPNGDKVVQTLTFHRGSYVIDVAFDVTNAGTAPIKPEAYFQLMRDTKQEGVVSRMGPKPYVGPVVYDDKDKYKKIDFAEIDKDAADPSRKPPYTQTTDNGWVGMVEHYFVVAWLPPETPKIERRYYTTRLDNGLYTAGVRYPEGTIAPGATGVIRASLYAGPQDQEALSKLAPGLNLVVDYGIFTIIAEPLFLLLKFLHKLIGNWGFAIIVM